jgi:hypothetical protein
MTSINEKDKKEKRILRAEDLTQFTGTLNYWRISPLYPFLCTDGVRYLAQQGCAFWLLDAIASWQTEPKVRDDQSLRDIQFWRLSVKPDQSALLICERDQGDKVVTQAIDWTDFPLPQIKLYLCNMGCFWAHDRANGSRDTDDYGVLILPSEY